MWTFFLCYGFFEPRTAPAAGSPPLVFTGWRFVGGGELLRFREGWAVCPPRRDVSYIRTIEPCPGVETAQRALPSAAAQKAAEIAPLLFCERAALAYFAYKYTQAGPVVGVGLRTQI